MTRVSCIILCYQNFKYIYGALDSIMNQTYKEIEIIVADDASHMFPKEKICEYVENRKNRNIVSFKIFSNKENIGTVKNYNKAIERASGEFIIPLSCDDEFYDENVLMKIVKRMESEKLNVLIARRAICDEQLNVRAFSPTDREIKKIHNLQTAQAQYDALARLQHHNMASGSVTYYRKSFLEEQRLFDEKYRLLEDMPAVIQITKNGNKLNFDYDLVAIKYRKCGVSSKPLEKSPLREDDLLLFDEVVFPYMKSLSGAKKKEVMYIYERKHKYPYYSPMKKIMFVIKNICLIIKRKLGA